jgi:hypothetical protein
MGIFSEKEAENFLEKQGFNVVDRVIIKRKDGLKKVKLDFPWVMKISSKHVLHKAKIGGTILGIKNLEQAEKAFDKLKKLKGAKGNVLIQEQKQGQEIILGLEKTDEFGLVIMVGTGGSNVEEIKDVSFRVTPITSKDAEDMLNEIKLNVQNKKYVIDNLIKLSNVAEKHSEIKELDINPLIVNKKEAIVVDARAVF